MLAEIVHSIKKVSDIIAETVAASRKQTLGIEQVNNTIGQLDEVTQQNAALMKETAAANEALNAILPCQRAVTQRRPHQGWRHSRPAHSSARVSPGPPLTLGPLWRGPSVGPPTLRQGRRVPWGRCPETG